MYQFKCTEHKSPKRPKSKGYSKTVSCVYGNYSLLHFEAQTLEVIPGFLEILCILFERIANFDKEK
jgi:hypothetical protein